MPYAIAGVGRSVGLSGSWGHYVQVLGWPPTGHLQRCRGESTVLTYWRRRHRRVAHGWVETVGAGTRGQSDFYGLLRWSVGRHGSSDLDEHTFGSGGASGNQLSCSLPFEPERPIVGPAWRPSLRSAMKGGKFMDLSPAIAGHPTDKAITGFLGSPGLHAELLQTV